MYTIREIFPWRSTFDQFSAWYSYFVQQMQLEITTLSELVSERSELYSKVQGNVGILEKSMVDLVDRMIAVEKNQKRVLSDLDNLKNKDMKTQEKLEHHEGRLTQLEEQHKQGQETLKQLQVHIESHKTFQADIKEQIKMGHGEFLTLQKLQQT